MESKSQLHGHRRTANGELVLKCLLIGDSGAGKTSLLLRFADDTFTESYISTIGVDFRFHTMMVGKQAVKLQIWDTAGQERFRTITSAYYRGADGIAMIYDVTNSESFEHVEGWLSEVDKYASPALAKVLIGTKADLVGERCVSAEDAQKLADKHNMPFIETSALNSTNVKDAFVLLTQTALKSWRDHEIADERAHPGLGPDGDTGTGKCCR